jgi:hypothetical protein
MPRNNRRSTMGILHGSRPKPPDRLRPDMAEEWRKIVARMPHDWFSLEHLPVLEEYCRTVCYARDFGAWLDKVDATTLAPDEVAKFKMVASQRARCTTLMALLANRLRLTVISQRDVRNSRAAHGTNSHSPDKPWEHDDDGDARDR